MLLKSLAVSYESASGYAKLILLVGYGGFFALWASTKPALTERSIALAGLLMLFSVTVFVLFEIYKMLHGQLSLKRNQAIFEDPEVRKDSVAFLGAVNHFEAARRSDWLALMRHWGIALWLTLPPEVIAIILLAWRHFHLLLGIRS
jgi:hypothetical protein